MKKPDRKAFQREYGPRAAAKYVTAMRKYRKFLKNQPKPKAETKTETKAKTPAKVTGVGPVASGAEYGRKLQKERQAKTPQPKAEVKPKPKQTPKPKTETKPSGSGVHGQFRPSRPASPTVRRPGSTTGASVDPRERQLRVNRRDAERGSTTKGRANIKAQVDAVSGSSKRNQRQVEERRRRARRRAMLKNRRQLLARQYNDM